MPLALNSEEKQILRSIGSKEICAVCNVLERVALVHRTFILAGGDDGINPLESIEPDRQVGLIWIRADDHQFQDRLLATIGTAIQAPAHLNCVSVDARSVECGELFRDYN